MDKMPEVGDVIRFNGSCEDDTWSVTKVHLSSFRGYYIGENPKLIEMHGRILTRELNPDLSRWEQIEDAFTRYVKGVRAEAGIIDDRS